MSDAAAVWPLQSQCDAFYGNPRGVGNGVVSARWYRDNIVMLPAPWWMTMGELKITRIAVHKKVAPVLDTIFQEILAKVPAETRKFAGLHHFGGAFNYRLMRGGSKLSMHAYGAAIDFDPVNNQLGDETPRLADFPDIIAIFKKYGAVWGGDWKGRHCDGMHFQFARVG